MSKMSDMMCQEIIEKKYSDMNSEEKIKYLEKRLETSKHIMKENMDNYQGFKNQIIHYWKLLYKFFNSDSHFMVEELEKIIIKFFNDKESMHSICKEHVDLLQEERDYYKGLIEKLKMYFTNSFSACSYEDMYMVYKGDNDEIELDSLIYRDLILLELIDKYEYKDYNRDYYDIQQWMNTFLKKEQDLK